jgi:hypothetical protein|tara:strand:- start:1574 stop:1774 length:201 start_codon:yes stop_codon:yes gene_type:complete
MRILAQCPDRILTKKQSKKYAGYIYRHRVYKNEKAARGVETFMRHHGWHKVKRNICLVEGIKHPLY